MKKQKLFMNNNFNIHDEQFIARWMSNELNAEEIKSFESHPDYNIYKKMKNASNQMAFSDFDVDKAYGGLKTKIDDKVINLNPKKSNALWKYVTSGIAAAVLLLLGFFFFQKESTYDLNPGETLAVQLPDNSEILLNGSSKLSFNKESWNENRNIQLDGEAYFKVAKGEKFTVNTTLGKVQVLGTQFTVNNLDDMFIVKCYEGRVGVTSGGTYKEITPGMAIQIKNKHIDSWQFTSKEPSWVSNNISNYRKIPVATVLKALQRQYKVAIEGVEYLSNESIFTGSFPNDNLEEAVKIILGTTNVKYALEGRSKVVILSK